MAQTLSGTPQIHAFALMFLTSCKQDTCSSCSCAAMHHLSLQQECPHHLPCWCQPLSSLHDTKRAIPQLLKQRQILLWDEAGQSLLLPVKRCNPTTSTRLRGQDPLPQAQRRCGRQLTKGGRRLALLGEVSSIWALSAKYLERG